MSRAQRPSDPRRGDGRDRASQNRRPGEASGPLRRAPQRGRGEHPIDPSRRTPQRRSHTRERDRPVQASARASGRVGSTAHPEAHRLTTRTDLSETVLGPRNYTPRRIGLLAAIAIVLLVTVSFPLRNHYQYLSDQKTVAQERTALEMTIAELEAEQKQLSDPAYIEQQARIRFGAVKPGETPYRVSLVDPVEKAVAERIAAEKAAQPWQTRVWSSISEPADPVMPESAAVLDGTSIPGGADTPAVPVNPGADTPGIDTPNGAAQPQPQQPQEDPPA